MANLPSEEIQADIRSIIQKYRMEDRPVRERQLRQWKRLNLMWEGFQNTWWNEVAHDWRVYDLQGTEADGADAAYYDKPANIFKALLESIIAALSVSVPGIIGVPDDADNPLDLQTATAAGRIADLIGRHNDEKLLWLHGLFTYCTQGMTAAYNYTRESEEYGTYKEEDYRNETIDVETKVCPICKTNLSSEPASDAERDEYNPKSDDVLAHSYLNDGKDLCPQCLIQVDPELQTSKMVVPRLVGYINKPKARQCIEIYGGLYVKVANYAMRQEDLPYLCLSREVNSSKLIDEYCEDDQDLADRIRNSRGSGGWADAYDKWARLSPQYMGEYPLDVPTLNIWWLRDWSFNTIADKKKVDQLKKKYPDGAKVVMINDELVCIENESLDDHWTLVKQPLSNYVHFQPIGEGLVPMQEINNEMISLTLQTIEHGIPTTFADPGVLNFEAYRQLNATPGQIVPTKPLSSQKTVQEAFYEVKTATLSQEVMPFIEFIQQTAQMVSGALPSLWGGAAPNSSKTASQYSMARSQALQRLQNTWTMFCTFWKEIHGKAIPAFIKNVVEDEKYVAQDDRGNFINVFIRKAELQGKIGSIELEAADQLPTTWAQKKETVMQLLASANPIVQQALSAPENLNLIKTTVGIPEFEMPGADQREFQYEEIAALLASQPISNPTPNPMTGQMEEQQTPSVDINPFDDNNIHAGICTEWLVSVAGRLTKTENPQGYLNVLLHWQKHSQAIQQVQLAQIQQQEAINASKTSQPKAPANNAPNQQPVVGALRTNVKAT